MRLLHVVSSVDPRGGGPIEGVRERGLRLVELGHQVEIACLDDPSARFVQEFPLPVHALGPPRSRYRYSAKLTPWLEAHATRFDGIVINGLWQYHAFATWRVLHKIRMPYVVFTHGMLDPWFKHTYPLKHLKKWLFWPWAEYRVLRDAAAVLFTSEEERVAARKSFALYRAEERVVAYGTRTPPEPDEAARERFLAMHPELEGKRVLLFLSRLHPKKGADLLLSAFAACAAQMPDLHLLLAGPDQHGSQLALERLALALGVGHRVTFAGMLRGEAKWCAFRLADAFVLPSHQENFGIAVAEALACGVPVLISDKVNIWREVSEAGAGCVAPDTLAGTQALLVHWLSLPAPVRAQMRVRAQELFRRRFTVDAMAHDLLEVLDSHRPVALREAVL